MERKEFIHVIIDYLKTLDIVGDYYDVTSKEGDWIYYSVEFENDESDITGRIHLFDLLTFIYFKNS